jgi:hypothetical protein
MHIPHETKAIVRRAQTILFIWKSISKGDNRIVNDLGGDVERPVLAG